MLSALISRFSLPLLAKDLVETANRRRTYVMRVVYALLLYSAALLIYVGTTDAFHKTGFQLLGTGEELLNITFGLQCVGICLFMPAMSVGAITIEKEKNTLTLLFLTRLGPWTILFEKYLARVVNMASYLLISLPLFGIAYSLGGVTQLELWSAIWTLLIFSAQVGAICMACSAFFQSTAAAFIWAYLIGAGLYLLPPIWLKFLGINVYQPIADALAVRVNGLVAPCHYYLVAVIGPALSILGYSPADIADIQTFKPITSHSSDFHFVFLPLGIHVVTFYPGSTTPAAWHILVRTIPIAFTILICLVLARRWLVSRAAVTSNNRLMKALRGIDRFFHRVNQNRWTKGRVLINDSEELPLYRPIAWRETRKRAFGTVRYLIRMLILIEFPTAAICLTFLTLSLGHGGYSNRSDIMISMSFLLWILSLLFLISKAATALPSERLRETFDVLLATPIETREIVKQKFAGVNRLIWVLSIPLATVALSHAIWIQVSGSANFDNQGLGWYAIGSFSAILIYPRMIAWLSMLVGLIVKSQTKAIFVTLGILLAWCVLPLFLAVLGLELTGINPAHDSVIMHLVFAQSPAMLIGAVETGEFDQTGLIVACSILEYIAITWALREICLSSAARMLGRPETTALYALDNPRQRERF